MTVVEHLHSMQDLAPRRRIGNKEIKTTRGVGDPGSSEVEWQRTIYIIINNSLSWTSIEPQFNLTINLKICENSYNNWEYTLV